MKNSTIYIKLGTDTHESGDYRSWGTTTDYFKIYCCKKCNHGVSKRDEFCSWCGAALNGKVDDYFKDKCSKLLATKRRERTKLIKNINGDNYSKSNRVIQKLTDDIDHITDVLYDWEHWGGKGDLPTGYNDVMNE